MPSFEYRGRDRQGRAVDGVIDGLDASDVATQLMGKGFTPIRIQARSGLAGAVSESGQQSGLEWLTKLRSSAGSPSEGTETPASPVARPTAAGGGLQEALNNLTRKKIHELEVQLATRELYAMMKAGVPIMRALSILEGSSSNPELAAVFSRIKASLDAGVDLATAFDRESRGGAVFSRYYISIIRIGELTGRLEESLSRLSKHLAFLRQTKEQIKAALRYPSFVILAAIVAVVVCNLFVIPQFEKVFKNLNTELPLLTRILLASSRGLTQHGIWVLLGTIALAFGFRAWSRSELGSRQWDRFKLKLPIVGEIIYRSCLARVCTSTAVALKSGVPIVQALGVVAENSGNKTFEDALEQMRNRVTRGDSVHLAAVATGVFPHALTQVIIVGEETGQLDELLEEMGSYYQTEVEYALSRLSARIEPILIVILGIVVLVLALGIFLPMWEMGRAGMKK